MYPGLPESLALLLTSHHSMRVSVQVLDTAMKPVGDPISNRILDGQVNVDLNAEVTRSATLTFLDPGRALNFDSDSPADGALYADRMVRITYDVRQPGTFGGKWIEVPIFTGPVTKFSRNGVRVTVEAQGKEVLAMGSPWRTYTAKKNRRKVDIIEEVMRAEGERDFALLEVNSKMPRDKVLTAEGTAWAFAQDIARSMGMHLFYDGAGRLRLRRYPRTSVFTFRDGDGGSITDTPSIDFLIDNVKNAVSVTGKKPKGAKAKVRARAVAEPSHPLSPVRLGRNGQPRYLAEFVDDPDIGSEREAKRVANSRLASLLATFVEVKFAAVVIPHLDAGDYVLVKANGFAMTTRLTSFSIPLTASGRMTVGYNRRMKKPNRKAIR